MILLVLMVAAAIHAQRNEIHILSTNDMHSSMDNFPQLAALADSLRDIDPGLLILSAGDNRTGNPLNDLFEIPAYPMVALMNQVGFAASALGNHEFDVNSLPRLIPLSNFSYICANIVPDYTSDIRTVPCKVFDVRGTKVGIIGVVQVNQWGRPDTHPDNVQGLKFEDPMESVRRYEWLSQECDVTILLSHIGYEADVQMAEDFPWLDLIVGGHTHKQLTSNEPLHNGVLITQNKNKLPMATYTTLTIDSGKVVSKRAEYFNLKTYPRRNIVVEQMVNAFKNNPAFSRVLAKADKPFNNINELGAMVCDAFMAGTGAEIGIENRRGVRLEYLPAGDITVLNALAIDPFGNQAVELTMTGEQLDKMLHAYSRMDINHFPHLGGLLAEVKLDKEDSTVIRSFKVMTPDGKPLDKKRKYRVVTNTYVSSTCTYLDPDDMHVLNAQTSDLIMQFLKQKQHVDYNGVERVKYLY
jgi:2',3'-cyclic-nucleotide 2'-phosphodiesterase (5'-nucleotidase family)